MTEIKLLPPFPFDFHVGPKEWVDSLGLTYQSWSRSTPLQPVSIFVEEESVDQAAISASVQAPRVTVIKDPK